MISYVIAAALITVVICVVDFSSFFLDKKSEELLYAEKEILQENEHSNSESVTMGSEVQSSDGAKESSYSGSGKCADSEYDKMVDDIATDFIDEVYKEI